ncbi:MAG: phosphoribosylaminoimidazolesuccinocarboxamide synthase [Sphaerochaetaceae bacterium]
MTEQYTEYRDWIARSLDKTLGKTNLPLPQRHEGKVRDRYGLDSERLLLVTTDRQSAFDRVLATVPFKGQVLNLISAWWFERTRHIIPNHMLGLPDANTLIARRCTVFPIEFVVRDYITGTTDTSLWTHYQRGEREYCGHMLPEGLRKNDRLDHPILTPTTKEAGHDHAISPEAIIQEGWMESREWETASQAALELFAFGQQEAAKRGLILVDTKYEFGVGSDGRIMLVDELHTPDSSRYWLSGSYAQLHSMGMEPENIDKEFLRLWFKQVCDPYHDKVLPQAPRELIIELSLRYIQLYEMITAEQFVFPSEDELSLPIEERIASHVRAALASQEELL